eukprot:TRINITY_DN7809_c0_g1_i2.p1 TRINITY_DN7809_c0_g1~~TRINITY_DN7809_c0_g1_i2.p1  ORF type:complete len:175 (-),score=7.36 TRINITY_DN7809_c0_g1_i2:172-696(-)
MYTKRKERVFDNNIKGGKKHATDQLVCSMRALRISKRPWMVTISSDSSNTDPEVNINDLLDSFIARLNNFCTDLAKGDSLEDKEVSSLSSFEVPDARNLVIEMSPHNLLSSQTVSISLQEFGLFMNSLTSSSALSKDLVPYDPESQSQSSTEVKSQWVLRPRRRSRIKNRGKRS